MSNFNDYTNPNNYKHIRDGSGWFTSEKMKVYQDQNSSLSKSRIRLQKFALLALDYLSLGKIPRYSQRFQDRRLEAKEGKKIVYVKESAIEGSGKTEMGRISSLVKKNIFFKVMGRNPIDPSREATPPPVDSVDHSSAPVIESPPVVEISAEEALAQEEQALAEEINKFITENKPAHTGSGRPPNWIPKILKGTKKGQMSSREYILQMAKNINENRLDINQYKLGKKMLEIIAPQLTHISYSDLDDLPQWKIEDLRLFLEACPHSSDRIKYLSITHPELDKIRTEINVSFVDQNKLSFVNWTGDCHISWIKYERS